MTLLDFLKDKKICIIGAHPDDIELGCGGTLNQIKELNPFVAFLSSSDNIPGNTGIVEECNNSMKMYGIKPTIYSISTRKFANSRTYVRDEVYKLKDFDVFFTHSTESQHEDHRILGRAVDDIMKDKTIFCWEEIHSGKNIPVNFWNRCTGQDMIVKSQALDCYKSQKRRPYFEDDAIITLARYRGNQILATYAEAFNVVRLVT